MPQHGWEPAFSTRKRHKYSSRAQVYCCAIDTECFTLDITPMLLTGPALAEWKRGWRVVLGAMIASGLGMPLFYGINSLFVVGISQEFGATRGQISSVQALLVVGALAAPLIGRQLDRFGFRIVFGICAALVAFTHLAMGTLVSGIGAYSVAALFYGAAGVGAAHLAYTRPINAWFCYSRGTALGLAAVGVAVSTAILAPALASLIEGQGWRAGYLALAVLFGLVGLPLTLMLVRNEPDGGPTRPEGMGHEDLQTEKTYLSDVQFWLMAGAMLCMAVPGAGLVSQTSPLVQEEGIGAMTAAYAVTAYALGQLTGRVVAGWFLDRVDPRYVAFFFTFVPALGLVALSAIQLPFWFAIVAVCAVGVQQGAEIDLFAYIVSRRYGIARYGAVYGAITAVGWIGNAVGILSFGWMHDATGSYAIMEAVGAGSLMLGAFLIAGVKISGSSHSSPEPLPAP